MYDVVIIGSGYAGSIMARQFVDIGKKVLILEQRNHIAGNMYDEKDENGILVHKYGPHISYMAEQRTFKFLQQYTEFVSYQHTVNVEIDGLEAPLPFNLNSIDKLFPIEEAIELKELLVEEYGMGVKIPILEMKESKNKQVRSLSEYIYEKVFLHYTIKMWGITPKEIDPSVTARVPIHISYDNRHFTHKYQVMPKNGYTKLFENMLSSKDIQIELNTDGFERIKLKEGQIFFDNFPFEGLVICSAPVDKLFNYKYGKLPYRSLFFEHKTHKVDRLQNTTVLNWPDTRPATRRTENKLLVCQPNVPGVSSTITEYPGEFNEEDKKFNCPYYPIPNSKNERLLDKYKKEASRYKRLVLIGRLAEYKYYNMEAVILATIEKFEEIKNKA